MKSILLAIFLNQVSSVQVSQPKVYGRNGEDYLNVSPSQDLARIKIHINQKGKGQNCLIGDWTSIHYTAALRTSGRVVADTHQVNNGQPKQIALGESETFKCLDLALTQVNQGTKAHISCPYDLAWGNAYVWPDIGGEPIPYHSDIEFDVEVVECNRLPGKSPFTSALISQPHTTSMHPNQCFQLHLESSADTFTDLALTCQDKTENCKVDQFVRDDETQQFVWDAQKKTISNQGRFLNIKNNHLVINKKPKTQWFYNDVTHYLETKGQGEGTDNVFKAIGVNQVRKWQELEMFAYSATTPSSPVIANAQWKIEYCEHHHE